MGGGKKAESGKYRQSTVEGLRDENHDLAFSFNKSFVFRMVSNPEPNHSISGRNAECPVVVSSAC